MSIPENRLALEEYNEAKNAKAARAKHFLLFLQSVIG